MAPAGANCLPIACQVLATGRGFNRPPPTSGNISGKKIGNAGNIGNIARQKLFPNSSTIAGKHCPTGNISGNNSGNISGNIVPPFIE